MNALRISLTGIFIFLYSLVSAQQWNPLGPVEGKMPSSANTASWISLAADAAGVVYIAYADGGDSDKLKVRKYDKITGDWEPASTAALSSGAASYISIAADKNNVLYAAFCDAGNGSKLIVKQFNSGNGSWETTGDPVSAAAASWISMVINQDGVPFVSYRDASTGNKLAVKQFNSSTNIWEIAGSGSLSAGAVAHTSMAVGADNAVYVAYQDAVESNKLSVKKYNNSTKVWSTVGASGFSMGAATYSSLAVAADNSLYVAYQDGANSGKATVEKFNNSLNSWNVVGTVGFTSAAATNLNLVLAIGNVPYVVFRDASQSNRISISRFNPVRSGWENVVSAISSDQAFYPAAAQGPEGQLYVAYQDSGMGLQAMVRELKNDKSEWESLGSALNVSSGSPASYTAIAVGANEIPFIAYQDGANFNKATVKSYNPQTSSWETTGSAGFSAGAANYIALAVDKDDIPVIAYQDGGNNNKLAVKQYDNSTGNWQTLGTNLPSADVAVYTAIAVAKNNTVYVAYQDAVNANKLTVKQFNRSTKLWEVTGTAGFSSGTPSYISLAVDENNIPYVAYQDAVNNLTVKRFNNSTQLWQTIGSEGFSSGPSSYISLAIDKNNIPYVAYRDVNANNKLTVKQFNSSVNLWELTGQAAFSARQVAYVSLAIDQNDVPYVAYQDGGNSNRLTIKQFNHSLNVWEAAGTEGFSSGDASYAALAISAANKIYSVYRDNSYAGNPVVQMLDSDNGNWQTAGASGVSSGSEANWISIAADKNLIPYIAYSDAASGNKLAVKQFNSASGEWSAVGPATISSGEASFVSLAVNQDNVPFVAYSRAPGKLRVKKYNNATQLWENAGTDAASSFPASHVSLAIGQNNIPYLAYSDAGSGNKLVVKALNSATNLWEMPAPLPVSAGAASNVSLAIDKNNVPYVAYSDASEGDKLIVKQLDLSSHSWATLGITGISAGAASYVSLAVDHDNIPYVAYSDVFGSNKLIVQRYNRSNNTWTVAGGANISSAAVSYISLVIDENNIPVIAYRDEAKGGKLTVKQLNASANTWQELGFGSYGPGQAAYTDLAVSPAGKTFLAYQDGASGKQAVAMILNRSSIEWENVAGGALSSGSPSSYITAIADRNNAPLVVYRDGRNGNGATVKRFNSTTSSWEMLGSAGFTEGIVNYSSIAVDQDNTPYVFYQDENRKNKASVKRYNKITAQWDSVGVHGFSAGRAAYTSIAFGNGNTPYVIYQDSVLNYKAVVKTFNSNKSSWETLGSGDVSIGGASYISIVLDKNNVPYVAYQDSSQGSRVTVKRFNPGRSGWQAVGEEGFSASGASYINLVFDNNNIPCVVYQDRANSGRATVERYNSASSSWEIIGYAGFTMGSASYASLVFDSENTPYVIYRDAGNANKVTVQRYNHAKSLWEVVGRSGFSGGETLYSNMIQTKPDSLYALYSDNAFGGQAIMKKLNLNSSRWDVLGTSGLSAGYPASSSAIAAGPDGTPYLVFRNSKNGLKLTVKKYSKETSAWQIVGAETISSGSADYPSIAVNQNNIPFVAYQDASAGNKLTVKRFNSATQSWVNAGPAGFSGGVASFISLAIGTDNIPYVSYRDDAASGKLTVKRFNNSTSQWETVGQAGFSSGVANYTSLSIGADHTPYVICQDQSKSSKATVYHFADNTWKLLGSAGISMGAASYTSIAVGSDNIPRIVYMDGGNSNRATAQEFNNSTNSWDILGTVGFTPGSVAYTSIALDNNNVPYIIYSDLNQFSEATVRKYNRASRDWEIVGSSGFSRGSANYTSILIDQAGDIYAAFQDAGEENQIIVKELNKKAASWKMLGSNGTAYGASAVYSHLAVSGQNIPYIIYSDAANAGKATVRKFDAGTGNWETAGNAGFSKGAAAYVSVATDNNNLPLAAYEDGGNYNRVTVKRLNTGNNQWETLGDEGFSDGVATHLSLAINQNGIPYVSYRDEANGGKLAVKRFNNTSQKWETVGTASPSAGPVKYTSILFNTPDNPYVSYQDVANGSKAVVKEFNSSNGLWETVGSGPVSAGGASFISLAVDKDQLPVVAYQDSTKDVYLSVKRLNALTGKWDIVGTEGFSVAGVTFTSVAVDQNNVPYVMYPDSSKAVRATAQRFNSVTNKWEYVGTAGFSNGTIANPDLAIGPGNNVYSAYRDFGIGGTAVVKQLNSKAFDTQVTGISGISDGAVVSFVKMALDSKDTPWLVYQDGSKDGAATVKTYNNTSKKWEFAGPAGFTAGPAPYTDIAVGTDDVPYVVYPDGDISALNSARVKRYNKTSSSWENVGAEGISTRGAAYTSIALNNNNVPYVAFQDEWNFNRATVKQYNSSSDSWKILGAEGLSAGVASYTSLAIDKNNIPYLAYQDGANGNKATVKAYNAGKAVWNNVGQEGFSAGAASYTSLAIDPDNELYVAYRDENQSGKATVKHFNPVTSKWETLGTEGFTAAAVSHVSLQVDKYNLLYAIYRDESADGRVTVSRFNPVKEEWQPVGSPGLSSGEVTYSSMAVGKNNALYIVYASGQAFAKTFDCVPLVTQQPQNLDVCKDKNAVFSANADGSDNSYLWQVNTGSGYKTLKDNEIYSGVKTNTLQINATPQSYKGYKYRCIVIGSCVTATQEATLNIQENIAAITPPETPWQAGERKRFETDLSASGGAAPYSYRLISGSLPAGLILTSDGKISGIPMAGSAGNYTFTVELTESSECQNTSSAELTLKVDTTSGELVDIRPVVTPNGDGRNDFFEIPGIEKYPLNHLVIINRNGTTVFDIKNYDNVQNVFKGTTTFGFDYLPQGTYFYILEFKDGDKWKKKTGYLVLKY